MYKAFLFVTLVLVALTAQLAIAGQRAGQMELTRSVIETQRKAIVASNLELTEPESQAFWPLYREYQNQIHEVNNSRVEVIENYVKHYENLNDEQANKILSDYLDYQKKYTRIRHKFVKKFNKILPATKTTRFYQIENKMDAVINYELAANIPLMKTAEKDRTSQR